MSKRFVFGKKIKTAIAAMLLAMAMMGCGSVNNSDVAAEVASVANEAASEVAEVVEEAVAEVSDTGAGNNAETDASDTAASAEAASNIEVKKDTESSKSSTEASDESASTASSQKISKDKDSNKKDADSSASASSVAASTSDTKAATEKTSEANTKEDTSKAAAEAAPQKKDYGRILFAGDSRTVDMFDAGAESFYGLNAGGISVICMDGGSYGYFASTLDSYGTDNFDTLVTWMGCNDRGNFSEYESYYNNLLAQGKNVVVCTVGPTADEYLVGEYDQTYYINSLMVAYNNSLVSWANANGIKVIDLYSYLSNTSDVYLDPADGIHFQPQPTTGIWNYIVSNLQ